MQRMRIGGLNNVLFQPAFPVVFREAARYAVLNRALLYRQLSFMTGTAKFNEPQRRGDIYLH